MQLITFPIMLKESFMLSSKVKHFIFSIDKDKLFKFIPGQFITIHFAYKDKTLKRSYSIANNMQNSNYIEFAAGYVPDGPATELLFNLKVGEKLNVNGPFGRLIIKQDHLVKRYLLLATSTGITPYRAMLADLTIKLKNNPTLQVVILQGVQKIEELLYNEEFLSFAKKFNQQVIYWTYLSRQTEGLNPSYQFHGYIQHGLPRLALNTNEDLIYLCGNPKMIDDAFIYLQLQGFHINQVIREKYISAKLGKA